MQPTRNRQTDSQNKTELLAQSARRAGSAGQTNRHKSVCVKAAEKRHAGREQSSGTPAEKGRAFRGLRMKKQQKNLCLLRTADKRQAGPGGQRRPSAKAAGGVWAGKQRRRRRTRLQQVSRTAAKAAAGNTRRGTGHKSPHNSGWPRKNGQPAIWRGTPDKKNPSEQAKCAFALLPARRGFVNRGRQKFASLFLAGTAFFCFALRTMQRAALHKRERRPRSLACRLGCGLPVANRKHRPNREMRPALIRVPPARRFSPAGSVGANSCATGTPLLACRLGRR